MDRHSILDVINQYTDHIWNNRDYAQAGNIFSEHFVDHDPLPNQAEGYAGYIDMIRSLHAVYPNLEMRNDDIYIDIEQHIAVVRWSAKGSSQGSIFGFLADKKKARMKGIDVFHIKDDRITAHWGEFDVLGIFK